MPEIKLFYFDFRGRGEFLRLVLEAAGAKYTEERIDFSNWPEEKKKAPFGTVPYITYDGKVVGQTIACAELLARELGFMGKTNLDAARILEVIGLWEDQLVGGYAKHKFAKTPEDKAMYRKKFLEEDGPKYLKYYEKFISDNGGSGYIVGKQLSLADFYIFEMLQNMSEVAEEKDGNPPPLKDLKFTILDAGSYPGLKKLKANVESDPKLKAYLAKRGY